MPTSLAALGWDEEWAQDLDELACATRRNEDDDATALVPGRVCRDDRGAADVLTADGLVRGDYDPLHPLDPMPTTGDWVGVCTGDVTGHQIVGVLPRRTALVRAASGEETRGQAMAANVDLVGLVVGLDTQLNPRRIERFVALGWASGATPLLMLTKADVLDATALAVAVAAARSIALEVEAIVLSVRSGAGVAPLRARLAAGLTLAMVGPSGVGKSTLANALLESDAMAIGEVRAGDHKGRHTTTHRQLLPLPAGGALVDMPGIRGLVPWDEDGIALGRAFPDVEALIGGCRFANCSHTVEPACALTTAVARRTLDAGRLAGWRRLSDDLALVEQRLDAAATAPRRSMRP